ncbi:Vacuolar protein sorting-associated protein 13, C-terminal [Phytophthora cactorum]|nr:Vacuolar protein sorting-associated protein 13, C-terminal [Phytophthora cactorum]
MKEDIEVIKKREEGEARMKKARREVEEKRYMERLKEEFKLRDTDGGGTLDVSEIGDLIRSATDCDNLTKTEFDATVADFVSIVDSDGSGDISLEEFESALRRNKILYTRLHHNVVAITGQEYVHSDMQRNKVPYLSGDSANTLANAAALASFWEHYEEQIGASMSSLKGQRPIVVQKKMVRAFKNYDYAQEAWNRIVKPSLVKPGEQSPWLLSKEMDMEAASLNPASVAEQQIFIQTVVSTSFGGFYLRLIDEMLPMGTPAIETSLEELGIYANFSVWRAYPRERSENSFGVAKISFDVYGNYYNTRARQIEPFIEFYQGILDIRKEPASPLEVIYSSDRYFQLNVTSAFMEAVNSNVATFSKVEHRAEAERPHGVNVKYYMVAKKRTKERVREEVVTAVTAVSTGGAHACTLLDNSEAEEYEQQSLKEKQLRQAFRDADQDGSGELDTEEVRSRSSSSILENEAEFAQAVEDFVALADTDKSGQVSWEEFKIAIAKSRATVDRYISVEIEGYRTIHGVPLMSIGKTQVYELTPFFEDVESEKSIAVLYDRGVSLLTKVEEPTREELQMAYACLHRVKDLDPNYEWIDSYYADCLRQYLPVLAAIHISVDGFYGLQVKVSGAECVRNGTAKDTELLMYNEQGEVARCNPEQQGGERFFMLPALELYKKMTKFEQLEAQKALRGEGNGSVSSAKRVKEKLGTNAVLPDPSEFVAAGKEVVYPSSSCIDNQPTVVIEKISANNPLLGTWSLTIQPQLVLHNVLPCGVEYAIVQPDDCPADTLTSKGEFRVVDNTGKDKKSRAVKTLGQIDYFAYVNEVNSRKMWVESGKTIQVFGLDLSKPALMTMRLCASETNRAATWSAPFLVHLEAERESFNEDAFELLFNDGPSFVFHPQWEENSARTVFFYSPFWIQNRSGLDLRFKLSRGRVCTIEEHRAFFPDAKEIPVMATASPDKALIGIRPFQETPPMYEGESLVPGTTKKYLPDFEKLGGLNPRIWRLGSGNYSFVLAFEIRAAPAQFFRSKIFVISPRFVLLNHVPRPLQMTPILLDKKGNRGRNRPEKYVAGLRIRDMADDTQDVGEWSPSMPLFKLASKLSDPNVAYNMSEDTVFWTRGSLGDGPVCSVNVHEVAETIFATTAEEIVLGPMESHSFAWEDPKGDLELRVTATHWKVYIDGSTRVFAMGDTKVYSEVRQRAVVSDWLSNTVIDVSMHGVGITLAESRRVTLMVHHVQFDDMTPHSAYPVVFAPLDSGFNSDKREGWLPGDGENPFFTLSCETLPQTGIVIVNDFDLQLGSMAVKLNLEYLIGLSNLVFQFIPGSDEATILQQGLEAKNAMLVLNIPFPDGSVSAGMLMYFKRWHMSGYDFDLVFDSLQEDKGEGISTILGNTMGSIMFHFGDILYHNRFFYEYDLIYDVVLKIVHSVIGQWYKIVGSVEMLGDPVGLATDIVDGFALAARQLKRDVRGKSRRKGESAVTVVQTVFGVPLRSIGKVSNGLGDVVKKLRILRSQEDPNEPRHILKSIAYGVTGFVKEPVRGAKNGGVKGFAKGIGRGTLQLVASPVVGTLGVVEKLSQSMSNTTHLMDEKHFEGTRRPARNLQTGSLKQLSDSNVITEVETDGYPAKELGEYKSSTARHTGTPKYDQSWLVGVTSLDTFIEVNVYHKRKPLPKKRLDTNAKMQLKRRKRVRGSIISKLASASEHPMEIPTQPPAEVGQQHFIEDEDEGFEDYDQEVSVLSGNSICLDGTFPPSPVGIPLQECESEAKIYLSIRYVNDMRRVTAVAHGALQRLPYVCTASEIQEMKFWRAPVRESNRIADPIKRAKNHTSRLINLQLGKLSSVTRQASLDFPASGACTHSSGRVYATLHNTGKQYERECQELRTKQEAVDCGLRCVEDLKKIVTTMRVANYPFTTRGITMGHIFEEGISYQIADTPGLIFRPDETRNAIEKLAMAMMEKTQASIGFVFDPTGSSGTPTANQILLRDELRQRDAKDAREKALEGIAAYKYKAGTYTYLDNVLNHFWTYSVQFLPIWMAPNLVTMIGTGVMMFTTVVQLYYSPHFSEISPTWVYILSALGLFFYQTMDALDGKQARRTGASSPLGQLSITAAGVGLRPYIALSSVSIAFYLAQWEEYHTGVMSCGNGFFGVTEGQLTLVAVHLVAAFFGAGFWTTELPTPTPFPVTMTDVLIGALVASNFLLAYGNISNVLRAAPDAIPRDELGNKHISKHLALIQLIPIGILLVLGSLWICGPDTENYANYPVLFLFPIGIGYVFFSTRMIVSHMCKIPFTPQLRVIIPFGFVIFNAYGPAVGILSKPLIPTIVASSMYVVFIVVVYLHFVSGVVKDICDFLNIFLFKIKPVATESEKAK